MKPFDEPDVTGVDSMMSYVWQLELPLRWVVGEVGLDAGMVSSGHEATMLISAARHIQSVTSATSDLA